MDKEARHAHDRMEERTPYHRSLVDLLETRVRNRYPELPHGEYFVPLSGRGSGGVEGYGVFRTFGKQEKTRPTLVTILGNRMKPKGSQLPVSLGRVPKKYHTSPS
jgi:hypothetical protein